MNNIWELNKYGSSLALIGESGEHITYNELESEGEALAQAVGRRCLAFILCKNEIGSVIGYTGFLNNGIVPAMLNSHLDKDLLNNLIEKYKPDYIWAPAEEHAEFPDMEIKYASHEYILLETGYIAEYALNEKLALLLTTSGSTGSPKFVRQSYVNILNNAESIVEYLQLSSSERPITTLPMNYTYGLSIINSHLLVGAALLLTEKTLMQKEFWTFFKEENATSFGGVPYTYEMLDKLRFYRMKLPSLRSMTQAGGKLLPELQEKFAIFAEEKGIKFFVMYGQCEATARMGYLPPDKAMEKKGSMGIPIPGGKFRIIDDKDTEIRSPYIAGELVYEGLNVTLGYAECGEDLIKGDENSGILFTGDMAQFDEDGFYYIVGRKKRFLKIYGNRVNLDELDQMIKAEFSVDVATTGTDDHLYIITTSSEYSDAIRDFVIAKTKLNPAAFKTIVIDSIPHNESGKVLYNELKKYYQETMS